MHVQQHGLTGGCNCCNPQLHCPSYILSGAFHRALLVLPAAVLFSTSPAQMHEHIGLLTDCDFVGCSGRCAIACCACSWALCVGAARCTPVHVEMLLVLCFCCAGCEPHDALCLWCYSEITLCIWHFVCMLCGTAATHDKGSCFCYPCKLSAATAL